MFYERLEPDEAWWPTCRWCGVPIDPRTRRETIALRGDRNLLCGNCLDEKVWEDAGLRPPKWERPRPNGLPLRAEDYLGDNGEEGDLRVDYWADVVGKERAYLKSTNGGVFPVDEDEVKRFI